MQFVGEYRAGRQLLAALQDDAAVGLLDHAGIERRIGLLVRGLAAVDLRRDDGISDVAVVVARVFVEIDHVVGEAFAAGREDLRLGGKSAEEIRYVVGDAAHQAKGLFGPFFCGDALRAQIGVRLGDLIAPPYRAAGIGRGEGHRLAVLRRGGIIEQPGERARGAAEGGVGHDLRHALAFDENGAPAPAELGEEASPVRRAVAAPGFDGSAAIAIVVPPGRAPQVGGPPARKKSCTCCI